MKRKILLVEDNTPLRDNTAELLQFGNYEIITACNGVEGLAIAKEQIPDLILSDIQMPRMNGYELLERIKTESSLSNTRFIFFTASAEKKEIEKGLQMGANGYLTKPFTEEDLLSELKKHFE